MNKYFLKMFLSSFLSLFFIEILFKIISFNTFFDFELLRITLFTLVFSLLTSFIYTLFKPLVAKILTCITVFTFGLYTLLQLNFKNFMGNFMSLSMLGGGGDADRISNEVSTFISSIRLEYYLCFLPLIILIILFIWKKNWFNYERPTWVNSLVVVGVVVVLHIISLLTLNVTPENQLKTNKELYKSPTLIDISLKEFGPNRFFIRDLIYFINGDDTHNIIEIETPTAGEEEPTDYTRYIDDTALKELIANEDDEIIKNLHQYYMSQSITDKNDYTGIFKDKNLVLIMVEALDLAAVDPDLTPTLYRLTQEGWYFNNYYAPKFSCTTGESEFIALTSIIPSNSVCTPFTYVDNNYSSSIFNLFNASGYTSTSYHGWDDNYYPRTKLHKNMGSTFYNADKLDFSTSGGWTSDLKLMEKIYPMFSQNDKFLSFIITVSMHFSYDFDDATTRKNWDQVKDLDTGISMKRYLAKAIEFDQSLEYLIDSLEKDGKLDDTVIVIFGDHHPYNLDFDYLAERSPVDRYEDLNEDLMPFIIYNSTVEPQVITKTASTFDILPTLANLFDLNYDPRYYTGKDLFSDEETIALFPTGSWVTDKAVYFASKNDYKLKDNSVNEEYIKEINKILSNKFTASDNTLKKDYFKYSVLNSSTR